MRHARKANPQVFREPALQCIAPDTRLFRGGIEAQMFFDGHKVIRFPFALTTEQHEFDPSSSANLPSLSLTKINGRHSDECALSVRHVS